MNGARRVTATGAAMFPRPGGDFGPDWPEVTRLVLYVETKKHLLKNRHFCRSQKRHDPAGEGRGIS